MYKIYHYPNCSTCKKALKWLDSQGIQYEGIHIVEATPEAAVIKGLYKVSDYPIKKFFNTSGKKYRELNLKDKISGMSDEALIELLSSDGMLIKRPIITNGEVVLVGFKEEEWLEKIK